MNPPPGESAASTAAPEERRFACRVCGGAGLSLFYTQGNSDEFRFHRCADCGLVNYDLAGGLDQGKYAREFVDPLDEDCWVNRAQTASYRFLRRRLARPGRMLEIGCGNGRLLHMAHQDGWEVRGLELSAFLAESVRSRLGIDVEVASFLDRAPRPGERYDAIVLRHVLEHLPDARRALASIRDLLRVDGFAYLEFPNIMALDTRFKRWLRRTGLHRKRYRDGYRPGHCNEFCRRSFQRLLDVTGFDLVAWETYGSGAAADFVFRRIPVGNKVRALVRPASGRPAP